MHEDIKDTPEYLRLVEVVASWFALVECCEDLLERVEVYGINEQIDADHQA